MQPIRSLLRRGGALLGALALVTPTATAASPGGLLVADGPLGGKLEIVTHDVRVTIRDGIAVTTFEEVFRNTEDRDVEALYTFPVPKGASVANFSMWIAGKEMVGEVVEKERAREIYESYKARRVDPGLLEQVDHTTFEMRIFPIPAHAEQKVRVTYYQELDFDADRATYVYPLATTTDGRAVDTRVRGRFSMELEVLSEIPIVELDSPSHPDDFVWAEHWPNHHQASLEQEGGDLARDVVLAFRTKRARTGLDLVASTPEGEDGFLQLTLTAGDELQPDDQGMDYVFVTDVSGSMRHAGKLGLSTDAVRAFLDVLDERDRVQLVRFNVVPTAAFDGLAPLSEDVLERADAFLEEHVAKGGTALHPALDLAYSHADSDRQLNVVLLSDGLEDQDDQPELVRSIRARPTGARVFCIGVGNDVNRPLLRQLATDAGGLAEFVSHGDDFARKARAFRRKLVRPAMEDVCIAFAGGGVAGVVPERLGNLFHGAPLRLYGRYDEPGPVEVTLTATIAGKPYEETLALVLPKVDDDHPEIERMWAWHRIQELEGRARAGAADDRTVEEIVLLSEGFSIPSRHASFLVLENDAEFQRWKIERRNVTRIARDRAAQQRLRAKLNDLKRVAAVPAPAASPATTSAPPAVHRVTDPTPLPLLDDPGALDLPSVSVTSGDGAGRSGDGSRSRGGGSWGGGALDPTSVALVAVLLVLLARRS